MRAVLDTWVLYFSCRQQIEFEVLLFDMKVQMLDIYSLPRVCDLPLSLDSSRFLDKKTQAATRDSIAPTLVELRMF